ncbi:hypothetical protein TNCV_4994511 [Trichonephila clavipes]|nr:hypothetical protein TNCV_4994511 [Trichonephila clavipes]
MVHIEVDGQRLSCQDFVPFHGCRKFLVVEIQRSYSSWLISQTSVTRFEKGKPFPTSTFIDYALTEKFVEIVEERLLRS